MTYDTEQLNRPLYLLFDLPTVCFLSLFLEKNKNIMLVTLEHFVLYHRCSQFSFVVNPFGLIYSLTATTLSRNQNVQNH
jgi:hypothetical protein